MSYGRHMSVNFWWNNAKDVRRLEDVCVVPNSSWGDWGTGEGAGLVEGASEECEAAREATGEGEATDGRGGDRPPRAAKKCRGGGGGVDAALAAARLAALELRVAAAVSVGGLRCHPNGNGDYLLRAALLHGRPHYARRVSAALTLNLYWRTPASLGGSLGAWVIDEKTDSDIARIGVRALSATHLPPPAES
jgi:hypothetical protein